MGHIPSVYHFFKDWDCYEGRVFDTWELDVIFGDRIGLDTFREIGEVNQTKEKLFNDQISFKFLSLEIEASGAFPQIQTSAQPQYSLYEEKWKLRVDNDTELKTMCKELSVQRDVAYNPAEAFDKLFPGQMYVDQNALHRALSSMEIRTTPNLSQRFMDFVRTRQLRDSVVDKVMLVNVWKFLLSRYNVEAAKQLRMGPIPLEETNEPKTTKQAKKADPLANLLSVNPKSNAIASPSNRSTITTNKNSLSLQKKGGLGGLLKK